jgi:hypothetical protein
MSDDYEGPCRICGGVVRVIRIPDEKSLSEVGTPVRKKRVCANPLCDSNTGQKTVDQVV